MTTWKTIAFTTTEIKALWLAAVEGRATMDFDGDAFLGECADSAIDKLWRSEKGMSKKGHPPGHHRGPELDLRRKPA